MTDEEVFEQVSEQCRAVAHMAECVAKVHRDLQTLFEGKHGGADTLRLVTGKSTHIRMEILGDMLNGMDAVLPEDEWIGPIFETARLRFPIRELGAELGARAENQIPENPAIEGKPE